MQNRKVWFLKAQSSLGIDGVGEVAPIERLSPEELEEVPAELARIKAELMQVSVPSHKQEVFDLVGALVPSSYPSIRCGLEMALLDLISGGEKRIFTATPEDVALPINGLVWMGDRSFMQHQIKEKLEQGFRCIKLKVGALDFDTELDLIKQLRKVSKELVIRLDANGAFQTNEVLAKLKLLSQYDIHSVEQPILPSQPEAMEVVCKKSMIPIALDEELIGITSSQNKMSLLQDLKPQYLVLKPTLHGGFNSLAEWIDLAEMHSVKWWVTSYLESNIGLNAIAQFANLYPNKQYHGLGTGGLYHNNIESPLGIVEGTFRCVASSQPWGL